MDKRADTLMDRLYSLTEAQTKEWPLLNENNEKLFDAPEFQRSYPDMNWETLTEALDYRKKSLTADLKAIAEGKRPCFLCEDARPKEQKFVEWGDYEILCNPYPLSNIHFTIVNRRHIPQRLGSRIVDMVKLARELKDCCIFYNGPKCGASAPDHMHFQAVDYTEFDNFLIKTAFYDLVKTTGRRIYISKPDFSPYGYFMLLIKKEDDVEQLFEAVMSILPGEEGEEPMMNVIANNTASGVRVVIVPRKKHRPDCYGTGEGQILVSPASIEMMGKFIVPDYDDMFRLEEDMILNIYKEVCYSHEEVMNFTKNLPK